jgi:hypothetical protein
MPSMHENLGSIPSNRKKKKKKKKKKENAFVAFSKPYGR